MRDDLGQDDEQRTARIVEVLDDAFAELMERDPGAFRTKYRKMAKDPHAFYRGTACVFYADVTGMDDPWARDGAERIWVHGDLHVENVGTYLASDGRLVFDVNDFDEAYLGHFTWDLQRFCASLALTGWQKALPEDTVRDLVHTYLGAYLDQVERYRETDDDGDFALRLDNTDGPIRAALEEARASRRAGVLDPMTELVEGERRFVHGGTLHPIEDDTHAQVLAAYERYLETIPDDRKAAAEVFYAVKDVAGAAGFGIGSAGLPAYNLLLEGWSQARDDDVVLSMKQANVPAVSRYVDRADIESYFAHEGERTVVSQHALQRHTDRLLGHCEIDGTGFVVSEMSPFEIDLEWDGITDPEEMKGLVASLGRATAKVHCASDEDSDQTLVDFQVEDVVCAAVGERRDEFVDWVTDFALAYSAQVRRDHALFVDAFREGRIGISAT